MIEKILERLEDYKYTHLVERDKERLEHCTENDRAEHCEGIDCFWCVWDKAISILQEVTKDGGWIPCSERLPIQNGWYLITNELGVVQQQYWGASRWQKLRDEAVIAWQPLPAPFKKGE